MGGFPPCVIRGDAVSFPFECAYLLHLDNLLFGVNMRGLCLTVFHYGHNEYIHLFGL